MNMLKVNASELAVVTVMSAMQACGWRAIATTANSTFAALHGSIVAVMISDDGSVAKWAAAYRQRRRHHSD